MSVQDRNIHWDAQALRKSVTVPLIIPAFGVDQDEPIYSTIPRYNWRLSDLHTFVNNLANNALTVSAQAVPPGAAVGSPRLLAAAAVTFGIDEFWRRAKGGTNFVNIAATAAQAFGAEGIATVLDGFWGVWLVVVDDSNGIAVLRQAPIMAFATEEIALANCPKVRPFTGGNADAGRLAILTINAVGGDFIAGTTNTNQVGVVNLFNTAPQQGHVVTIIVSSSPRSNNSVLGQQLKDASGTNILQGKGGDGGDALVVMTKCFGGASVLTGPAQAVVEYRPWPSAGEGVGDASVSQNRPSFVP